MKIVALNGLLGYGYSEEALYKAFEERPDFLGVDAGSTDPGPYYLGSGKSFTDYSAVKRDLCIALPLALKNKVPFIIGTAGGAGSSVHLNLLRNMIFEIAKEEKLSFKMALIYTDVNKEYLKEKLAADKIRSMGPQLKLDTNEIEESVNIVSQIGVDPIIEALKSGVDLVVAGRACDTAIYAAPCIMNGFDPGLSYHMAKIMECGTMCCEPITAADVMQANIYQDYFDLTPANTIRKCTVERVAAHTMYEQANPYKIFEPDGMVDLKESEYIQLNERTVRVKGSKFIPAKQNTLKIEGVKLEGYRTISIGGIKDPQTSMRIDELFEQAKCFVIENLKGRISQSDYKINLKKYGMPLIPENKTQIPENDIGIIIDVVGKSQDIANTICALMRARLLHFDYQNRKSTAGNIAFPYSPSDIQLGPVYCFNIYHLAEVDNLNETSKIEYRIVGEKNDETN